MFQRLNKKIDDWFDKEIYIELFDYKYIKTNNYTLTIMVIIFNIFG